MVDRTRHEQHGDGVARTRHAPDGEDTGGVKTLQPAQIRLTEDMQRRFEDLGELGSGGEATVLLVGDRERDGDELFALKIYRRENPPLDEDVFERVYADEQRARRHVVWVFERGRDEMGRCWELQEYVAAGTLKTWLDEAERPLGEELCRGLLEQVVASLDYLHEVNVFHRDLKPANLLVRNRDLKGLDVALADFGLATWEQMTRRGLTARDGTAGYTPPETSDPEGQLTSGYDFWPLGIILHEVLVGRSPFHHGGIALSDDQLDRMARRGVPLTQVERWPDWHHLLTGLLQQDPADRFGVAEVMAWLDGELPPLPDTASRSGQGHGYAPYPFGKHRLEREFGTPGGLVTAFVTGVPTEGGTPAGRLSPAESWREAVNVVSRDRQKKRLAAWLADHPETDSHRVDKLLDGLDADEAGPDRRIVRLAVEFAPDLPPIFRGVVIGHDQLRGLADQAQRGDGEALELVTRLFENRILHEYALLDGHDHYADVAAQWRAASQRFNEIAQKTSLDSDLDRLHPEVRKRSRARLLVFLLDPIQAETLYDQICTQAGDLRTHQRWLPHLEPPPDRHHNSFDTPYSPSSDFGSFVATLAAVDTFLPIAQRRHDEQLHRAELQAKQRQAEREEQQRQRQRERDRQRAEELAQQHRARRAVPLAMALFAAVWWGLFLVPILFVLFLSELFEAGISFGRMYLYVTVFGVVACVILLLDNFSRVSQGLMPRPSYLDVSQRIFEWPVIGWSIAAALGFFPTLNRVTGWTEGDPNNVMWMGPFGALVGLISHILVDDE